MKSPRPNTFIVGAPKCGTSSLHDYLGQHPDAFMCRFMKEPDYFCNDLKISEDWRCRTLEEYLALFAEAGDARRIGESSVWYLMSEEAPRRILEFDSAAKIIIMLRNPVEAAYSQQGQFIWSCNEDILDFEEAVAAEEDRRAGRRIPPTCFNPDGLQYRRIFRYYPQVKRYLDVFPKDQVKIIFFEDFVKDTAGVYRQTLEFLGLPPFEASLAVVNPAKPVSLGFNRFFAKRPGLRRMVHRFIPGAVQRGVMGILPFVTKTIKRPNKLPPEVKKRLSPLFQEDLQRLSELVGRDLAHWR
jgi:hypothetical protein